MPCKCSKPTTGGAGPGYQAGAVVNPTTIITGLLADPDNGVYSFCPPGEEFNQSTLTCDPVLVKPPENGAAPKSFGPTELVWMAPAGNGNGNGLDYSPADQPFPWLALLIGVGAVIMAAK